MSATTHQTWSPRTSARAAVAERNPHMPMPLTALIVLGTTVLLWSCLVVATRYAWSLL